MGLWRLSRASPPRALQPSSPRRVSVCPSNHAQTITNITFTITIIIGAGDGVQCVSSSTELCPGPKEHFLRRNLYFVFLRNSEWPGEIHFSLLGKQ